LNRSIRLDHSKNNQSNNEKIPHSSVYNPHASKIDRVHRFFFFKFHTFWIGTIPAKFILKAMNIIFSNPDFSTTIQKVNERNLATKIFESRNQPPLFQNGTFITQVDPGPIQERSPNCQVRLIEDKNMRGIIASTNDFTFGWYKAHYLAATIFAMILEWEDTFNIELIRKAVRLILIKRTQDSFYWALCAEKLHLHQFPLRITHQQAKRYSMPIGTRMGYIKNLQNCEPTSRDRKLSAWCEIIQIIRILKQKMNFTCEFHPDWKHIQNKKGLRICSLRTILYRNLVL